MSQIVSISIFVFLICEYRGFVFLSEYFGVCMHLSFAWIFFLSIVIIVAGVKPAGRRVRSKLRRTYYYERKELMTAREKLFYATLCEALPEARVFPQVAMSAVIGVIGDSFAARNRFDRKIFDFVICSSAGDLLYVIELDDKSHLSASARWRDSVKNDVSAAAGLVLLRYPSVKVDQGKLQADFERAALLRDRLKHVSS